MTHPSFDITGSLSLDLEGKKIILCVSGSVAAVRSGDIARLLMRHGADVFPVMTKAARGIIHPDYLHWATGNPVITEITGHIEHVALAGNVPDHADLLLVAPATANTLGKIAGGIDDTPVTTFVTTGLGEGIPLIVVPAMHQSMYEHPFVISNIDRLRKAGIDVLLPREEEGKAKIPEAEEVLQAVLGVLGNDRGLAGKKVLITAGRTVEYLDPIRVLTNNSSGKMGMALARRALSKGARVRVVYGKGTAPIARGAEIYPCETASEMKAIVDRELEIDPPDIIIAAAAVGDWKPVETSSSKIPTQGGRMTLELEPTPKILDGMREKSPKSFICAFRAQYALSTEDLSKDGRARLNKADANLIAINDTAQPDAGFETDTNRMLLIDQEGNRTTLPLASKDLIADGILKTIENLLAKDS